jgi:dephospho-CoA kinase
MMKAGITGGIGSGKSTIAGIFELLGVPVYNSDARAKQIMHEDPEVKVRITSLFGHSAYLDDGTLNRVHIAEVVFKDKAMLERLNAIVHPAVGTDFEKWCAMHNDAAYILKEAALIFEAGIHEELDYVIIVTAPEEVRIKRVMDRDGTDEASVRSRMVNQWPDKKKMLLSDHVIVNDNEHSLLRQVMEVHNFLINRTRTQAK